jgi:hypothetical protein
MNIKFFDALEDAFKYQNEHGGALYISGNNSATQIEYELATYLTGLPDEEIEKLARFCVADERTKSIIERPCFYMI